MAILVMITGLGLAQNGITMLYPAAANNDDALSYLACV